VVKQVEKERFAETACIIAVFKFESMGKRVAFSVKKTASHFSGLPFFFYNSKLNLEQDVLMF
jgi:hypothetical protein